MHCIGSVRRRFLGRLTGDFVTPAFWLRDTVRCIRDTNGSGVYALGSPSVPGLRV